MVRSSRSIRLIVHPAVHSGLAPNPRSRASSCARLRYAGCAAAAPVELAFEGEALSRVDVQPDHGKLGLSGAHGQREPRPLELGVARAVDTLAYRCAFGARGQVAVA